MLAQERENCRRVKRARGALLSAAFGLAGRPREDPAWGMQSRGRGVFRWAHRGQKV